ncbi:MAG TPA: glycosyltransferase family 4 protein [Gaiellaceae bacterium]|jgi:glycosyltransferase involved in cell wall biosynthesis
MRVCIVTVAAHGIGGMQDHTRDLVRGLAALGHDVEVITAQHPDGLLQETKGGATWWYLPFAPKGVRTPRRNPHWLRASYRKFAERHAVRPFDVVHSESTSAIKLLHKRVHKRVPLVATFHGNAIGLARASVLRAWRGGFDAKVREAKHLAWLSMEQFQYGHWWRFRACDWMVVAHQQFEETRRESFLVRERGHVVPNGVDTSVFHPRDRAATRSELGLESGPLIVGVGRLNSEKSFDLALRALAALDAELGARLVVVGDGEERAALEALAAELGIDERVDFVGSKSTHEVAAYMAAADVFVFPTQREEAAPMVLPQAMATGAPVIASSIGGITEVIEESGRYGVLIQPGDLDALTREIAALLSDDERRARLGAAARQRVMEEYTLERMVERTLEVYEIAARRLGR